MNPRSLVKGDLAFAFALGVTVIAAMIPATIVIPVLRPLVALSWPGSEWVFYSFMASNLLGACVLGPWLVAQAERRGRRRAFAMLLALVDGLALASVAVKPPLTLMLLARFFQGAASVSAVSLIMGAARSERRSALVVGAAGSAVIVALVVGIPLGAITGRKDPTMALWVGSVCGVVAAALASRVVSDGSQSSHRVQDAWRSPLVRWPVAAVSLERFSVGLLTVTLQLHAFHVMKVSDHTVSRMFTVFLACFAFAMVPLTRWAERQNPFHVVALGAALYATMFCAMPFVGLRWMWPLLIVGGIGSAGIYGPSLAMVASAVPVGAKSSAMGLLNAAGTFGMFCGNVLAGVVTSLLLSFGTERAVAYGAVFGLAGVSQLITVLTSLSKRRALRSSTLGFSVVDSSGEPPRASTRG
jgi:MFS family permease